MQQHSLDSYLRELRVEGALDSKGVFTVDLSAEKAKLRALHASLGDRWFLCFLQAAASVQAQRFEIRFERERFGISWQSERELPDLSGDESNEFLQYLFRGLSILEAGDFPTVTILQWKSGGQGQCLVCSDSQRELFELPADVMRELSRLCHWSSESPYYLVVETQLPKKNWILALRQRLSLQKRIGALAINQACFSPLQFAIDGYGYGQGWHGYRLYGWGDLQVRSTRSEFDYELAVEHIVGPNTEDTFVKSREPGMDGLYTQPFDQLVGPLGPKKRLLVKWSALSEESPFPFFSLPYVKTLPSRSDQFYYQWRETAEGLRPGLVPHLDEMTGENGTFYKVAYTTQLPSILHLRGDKELGISRGLPCYCTLAVPIQPKGDGKVHFIRRGVLIDSHSVDLGVPGAVAYTSCPGLSLDASGFKVVINDEYNRLVHFLRSRALQLASDTIVLADNKKLKARGLVKALAKIL